MASKKDPPPVLEFEDEWAAVQYQTMARQTAEIEAKRQIDMQREQHKQENRESVMAGIAYGFVLLLVAAVIFGVVFLIWRSAENNGTRSLEREREQTKQVQACTTLDQPLERQYCLLRLDTEAKD